MHKLSASVIVLCLLWPTHPAAGSGPASTTYLLQLPGDLVPIRYTPGSLDRAVSVQGQLENLVEDFKSWSRSKAALIVLLLSREEWQGAGFESEYGLPEPAGGLGLAMSAYGDADTVELWQGLLGARLPTLADQPNFGTPEQAASLALGDLVALVDAARICLVAGGFRGDQAWVDGVLAHIVALSVIMGHQSLRLPEVRMVYSALTTQGGGAGAYSLAVATRPPDLRARLWFEGQYFEAASLVAQVEGKAPAKAVLKQARKSGGMVRAAALISSYPELGNWLKTRFGAE